jgi:hypothetical protein
MFIISELIDWEVYGMLDDFNVDFELHKIVSFNEFRLYLYE